MTVCLLVTDRFVFLHRHSNFPRRQKYDDCSDPLQSSANLSDLNI